MFVKKDCHSQSAGGLTVNGMESDAGLMMTRKCTSVSTWTIIFTGKGHICTQRDTNSWESGRTERRTGWECGFSLMERREWARSRTIRKMASALIFTLTALQSNKSIKMGILFRTTLNRKKR